MEKKSRNLLIGGIILSGLAYLAYKKYKKNKEEKSNLVDEMIDKMGKPINQFTLTNNTGVQKTIILFDAYRNVNPPPTEVIVQPPLSYFNNTLLNDPKKVKSIKFMVNSSAFAQAQATQIITRVCKDASGDSDTKNYFPMVSVNQFQSNMTEIKPDNLILDGQCVLRYVVQPNTTVTLIMEYETKEKGKLLNK